jgi:hypothetical protein
MHNENHLFKKDLLEQLSPTLLKLTSEYKNYSEIQLSYDSKSFSAYQADCKSALTHLHLLTKVLSWASEKNVSICDANYESDLDKIISDAKAAMRDYKNI